VPYLNDLNLERSEHQGALLRLLAVKGTQCLTLWKVSVAAEYLFFYVCVYIWI